MAEPKTLILDHNTILTKIDRIACEICEKHTDSAGLLVVGLNERGFYLASALVKKMEQILPSIATTLVQVVCEGKNSPAYLTETNFHNEHVLVVDDVINTGRTLMMVLQHIFEQKPLSIETAFLAKREHRSFPVKADYVGISLATTMLEHVHFDNSNPESLNVFLN